MATGHAFGKTPRIDKQRDYRRSGKRRFDSRRVKLEHEIWRRSSSRRSFGINDFPGPETHMLWSSGERSNGHPRTRGIGWPIVDPDDMGVIRDSFNVTSYWFDPEAEEVWDDYCTTLEDDRLYDIAMIAEAREMYLDLDDIDHYDDLGSPSAIGGPLDPYDMVDVDYDPF